MFAIRSMMGNGLTFAGHEMVLLPCGALFWPRHALLVVADLHLEKGSAMARGGWLIPPYDSLDTLQRLAAAVRATGAAHVLALGDSFHDSAGPARISPPARALLSDLVRETTWTWVIGNHDGASAAPLGGTATDEAWVSGVVFRHEARRGETRPEVSGHFHPKVRLETATGGSISRRCFARAGARLVLPAYGSFAGGLDIDSPDLAAALGGEPEALVPLAGGIVRAPARARAA